MGPEVVAISEKRCLTAALVGNILNSGQANTKAALRLAGQTPAVDPMEPGGGGISYYDGEKSIGGNTFGTDPFRRRKIGFVFQSYNLVPVLNVYENIVLPIELDGNPIDKPYVEEILSVLGLDAMQHRLPNQLSGGQQQRVAIARALATKPAIILADEPTGNLDSRTSQDVLSLMKVTGAKFGQTIVMITHNEEIAQLSDRIIRIEDGKIRR